MAGRGAQRSPTIASGRRGFYRYLYGTHFWIPESQADWSKGIVRDVPRTALPPGSVYDLVDYLVFQEGLLARRGGAILTGTMAAGARALGIKFCEFPAGAKIVAINDLGALYAKDPTAVPLAMTALGGTAVTGGVLDKPKFRVGGAKTLLVVPNGDGTTAPVKWDGTAAPAVLGGSPPAGRYAELYKSRLALAGSAANPNRIYFSPTPDIESTWDTANSWIDADYTITGLAALQDALLVFSAGHCERITGATPPPNTDMTRGVIGAQGCFDARSICVYNGLCYFANMNGVYETNGVSFRSLTDQGGIGSYWRGIAHPSAHNPRAFAAEVYRDHLIISITTPGANYAFVDVLVCYLPRLAWHRFSHIRATMFTTSPSAEADLYYSDPTAAQIQIASGIFDPAGGAGYQDQDGTNTVILPIVEFRPFGDPGGGKSFGDAWLTYDMRVIGGHANPELAITVKTGAEADVSSTPTGVNLLAMANSDFESGVGAWAPFGGAALAANNADAYSGAQSLAVTPTNPGDGADLICPTLTIGQTYTFSGYMKGVPGTTLKINVNDGGFVGTSIVADGTWQRITFTRLLTTTTAPDLVFNTNTAAAFRIDAVQVELGSSATDFRLPLGVTTTTARKRFSINKEAEFVTIRVAQTVESAKTEIYDLTATSRGHTLGADVTNT